MKRRWVWPDSTTVLLDQLFDEEEEEEEGEDVNHRWKAESRPHPYSSSSSTKAPVLHMLSSLSLTHL